MNAENLYSSAVSAFRPERRLANIDEYVPAARDFHFAMRCNGYFMLDNEHWKYSTNSTQPFVQEFTGQRVTFFGPQPKDRFFSAENNPGDLVPLITSFRQPAVTDVIAKYRDIDENQAARIAFVLGGIVRHLSDHQYPADEISNAVGFVARMVALGERKSGDAIASAATMYVFSGGPTDPDRRFSGAIYHMADAIREDPITATRTADLGLSQVARLAAYDRKISGGIPQEFPDISEYKDVFKNFPTVGAEFHFSTNAPFTNDNFWQRLALLNMSQYQRGSYVQLSRNDRDVIEVRMNPSVYPVTIANWSYMRRQLPELDDMHLRLLPELDETYFTVTLNRNNSSGDFAWRNNNDRSILNNLRAIGMLSYAAMFHNIPRRTSPEEVDFGAIYLGQTVKMDEGAYNFSGNFGGGEGEHGQLGIYTGYGKSFPRLTYYLSMALANPDILSSFPSNFLARIKTLGDALNLRPDAISQVFDELQYRISKNEELAKTEQAGKEIMKLLNP